MSTPASLLQAKCGVTWPACLSRSQLYTGLLWQPTAGLEVSLTPMAHYKSPYTRTPEEQLARVSAKSVRVSQRDDKQEGDWGESEQGLVSWGSKCAEMKDWDMELNTGKRVNLNLYYYNEKDRKRDGM